MNGHRLQGIGMTSLRTRERLIERLIEQGIQRIDVLEAMRDTPRHLFIDEAMSHRAYEDVSLPIGHGQTISQPFVVARMTEAVVSNVRPDARVLEIGTGCGYQSAVLARLVSQVYSVERIAALHVRARDRLRELSHHNVHLGLADGNYGWTRHAPYDAIIATAVADKVPDYLVRQLVDGGILVIPVGTGRGQKLRLYRKSDDQLQSEDLLDVLFVPFLSGVIRDPL